MPARPPRSRYEGQRKHVTPPHVSLGDLRIACDLTIDALIRRVEEKTGRTGLTRGAISAIEHGHRGASDDLLRDLEIAYGIREGAITTTYRPRAGRSAA